MKYIDSEKLIAEIERRREKCADVAADERNEDVAEYYRGKEVAYDETSDLITSLRQEQPSLPSDLDEAAEKNFETMEVLEHENIFEETHSKIFKAGAEWMAGQGETVECSIDWYDGHFLDFSEEQLYSAIVKAELEVGDKVLVQIRKK